MVEIVAEDEKGALDTFVRENGERDAVLVMFVWVGREVG